MQQEITYGRLTKIAGYIFGLLFAGGGCYFFNVAATGKDSGLNIGIGILILALGVYMVLNTYRKKVIIANDHLTYRGTFNTKTILFKEIKGYRIEKNTLVIESKDKLRIAITDHVYLTDDYKILNTVRRYGVDLDRKAHNDELKEILDDNENGFTRAERKQSLNKAKKIASYTNYIGIAIGIWAGFYPNPYNIAICVALIFPVVALFVLSRYKNIISPVDTGGARPAISWAMLAPSFGLMIRSFKDYDLLNEWEVLLPACCAFAISCLAFYLALPKKEANKYDWLWVSLFAIPYCYAATIHLNCMADNSPPLKFNTSVQNKYTSKSKGNTHYHLTLTPWQRHQEPIEIEVTRTEYEQTPVDGPVGGHIKRGLLSIKWFYLDM
ncbi:hypothetical protein [Mucilaginibacter myungsuensis]|uniref:Uncharacterized protein n=1 Tax=Mucilaginibacter myungsuensis TaxID=649104 RepID=A0A929PW84_9SPHI|nr:hypothetical protein [Mucilaginibacter myungsuensis]MBE9662568.1 hypothetical protein [Mucilaginibacter myungsuensis]MDN3597988.1 hypothetical protein [Mucilaginibacter myungsuensis]